MSDKPATSGRHHDATPGSAADRSAKTAVPDTFPASDPVAPTPAVGTRAVEMTEMMDASDKPDVPNPKSLTARFQDHVTAKLAVEKLVRDLPLDPRCATLSEASGATTLQLTISGSDTDRAMEMLRSGGGDLSA
ncbi:hypothetical protein [Sabulicella glaciei]|uniref:Uncharacterized protein n=1 Tax=Sabulicella glaciei TaxID=2984948 RepID=A0ABT3P1I7_9PROT|nr:hypothetical protein [Roseococcus sp. MDT2-1-1]MCW8088267.1 hypothetical protein [Roseococcus sp. MDT2-1-1]